MISFLKCSRQCECSWCETVCVGAGEGTALFTSVCVARGACLHLWTAWQLVGLGVGTAACIAAGKGPGGLHPPGSAYLQLTLTATSTSFPSRLLCSPQYIYTTSVLSTNIRWAGCWQLQEAVVCMAQLSVRPQFIALLFNTFSEVVTGFCKHTYATGLENFPFQRITEANVQVQQRFQKCLSQI